MQGISERQRDRLFRRDVTNFFTREVVLVMGNVALRNRRVEADE